MYWWYHEPVPPKPCWPPPNANLWQEELVAKPSSSIGCPASLQVLEPSSCWPMALPLGVSASQSQSSRLTFANDTLSSIVTAAPAHRRALNVPSTSSRSPSLVSRPINSLGLTTSRHSSRHTVVAIQLFPLSNNSHTCSHIACVRSLTTNFRHIHLSTI